MKSALILVLVLAAALGYGMRAWQDTSRMAEMQNRLLSLWALNIQRTGFDPGQVPHDLWKQTQWAQQFASDLRRPVDLDAFGNAIMENEDSWGTAYLITHEGKPLQFQESMSTSVQDDHIRFLCFLLYKKCLLPSFGGPQIGNDLGTYPPAALNRNLMLIRPTLKTLLARGHEDWRHVAELFLASQLSQPWAEQMCMEHFQSLADHQQVGDCLAFWRTLAKSAGQGLHEDATLSAETTAGAAVLLRKIRAVRWEDKSPSDLHAVGRVIDEYIRSFPNLTSSAPESDTPTCGVPATQPHEWLLSPHVPIPNPAKLASS